nr:hypothetical protein [Bacilli bacterium]
FMALGVQFAAGDVLEFHDFSTSATWAITNLDVASVGFEVSEGQLVCTADGTYDLYLKMNFGEDQIYIEGSGVEPVVPQGEGYGYVINGGEPGQLTKNPSASNEYMATGVAFEAGDVLTFYDYSTSVGWAITNLDSYSVGFSSTEEGLLCNEKGTYDLYLKMIYGGDQIYIGQSK